MAATKMAKSKRPQRSTLSRRRAPSPPASQPPAAPPQLGYDPTGPKEPVDIVSTKDGWSEFTLSDGTVLRAKAVVLDVRKMLGQYNQEGDPIYEMQLTMVSQAKVPDDLKKNG
jgi:hypothetical protein